MFHPESWERVLRVFVSSTFEDLANARDVLAKRAFPRVRAHCEDQGITFTDVDLRWGVTPEAIDQGRLLEHCFSEIERSNCFVGVLGSRYGTVVPTHSPQIVERYPWVSGHEGKSITELEFRMGALRPGVAPRFHAFYFLNPTDPCKEDLLLLELKQEVRSRGFLVREEFAGLQELEDAICRDLTAFADSLVAEDASSTAVTALHHGFARRRAELFTGRGSELALLNDYLRDGGTPLILTGTPGVGKTALLAAWCDQLSKLDEPGLAVFYFADVAGDRAGLKSLLELLIEAGKEAGLLQGEFAKERTELPQAIPDLIYALARQKRLLLVVDGIDRFDDSKGAHGLLWLPAEVPEGARIVVSTRPGVATQAAWDRKFRIVQLLEFSAQEQSGYTSAFLSKWGKKLSSENLDLIRESRACDLPAFLDAVLNELRVFPDYRRLEEELSWYLASGSLEALYGRILSRLEEDTQIGPPGFVAEALSLILAARRGLLEAEIVDLLGRDGQQLAASSWIPLRQRLSSLVSTERGLLAPVSEIARRMIQRHFGPEFASDTVHGRLAGYFAARLGTPRGREEAAWQARRANQWERLADLWVQPPLLETLHDPDIREEARLDWLEIERRTDRKASVAYARIIDAPWESSGCAIRVADLLVRLGCLTEAHELLVWLHRAERFGQRTEAAEAESGAALSTVQLALGKLFLALTSSGESIAVARMAGDRTVEARCTLEAANLFAAIDGVDQAAEHYKTAAAIFGDVGLDFEVGSTLNNLAVLREKAGDYRAALETYKQAEQAFAKAGSFRWLTRSRSHQASLLWLQEDRDGALNLWNTVTAAFRALGDEAGLALALNNCGGALAIGIAEAELALPMLDEAEILFKRNEDIHGQANIEYSRLVLEVRKGSIDSNRLQHLIELRRQAGTLASLEGQLNLLRQFVPGNADSTNAQIDAAFQEIRNMSAKRNDRDPSLGQAGADPAEARKEVSKGMDPFLGLSTEQMLERAIQQTNLLGVANKARHFKEALHHANAALEVIQAIEKYRPDFPDQGFLRMNAFNCHFNLALVLFKAGKTESSLLESVGAARRYAIYVDMIEGIKEAARDSTQSLAEALADLLEHLVEISPQGTKVEAYRARASAMRLLADAQPLVFLARFGSSLRGLSFVAHEIHLEGEALSAAMESVDILRKAVDLQGNAHIRELGISMRYAIDTLGRIDLKPEYDAVVKREIEYIVKRLPGTLPGKAGGP